VCAIFHNEIKHIKNRCTFSEDFCQIVLAVFVAYRYKIAQAMTPRDGDIEMNIIDDRTDEEKFQDAVWAAEAAFKARATELGDSNWEGMAYDAHANAFAIENHKEYPNDLVRWEVALNTLEMYADCGWPGADR
jgi:hypothetical protein